MLKFRIQMQRQKEGLEFKTQNLTQPNLPNQLGWLSQSWLPLGFFSHSITFTALSGEIPNYHFNLSGWHGLREQLLIPVSALLYKHCSCFNLVLSCPGYSSLPHSGPHRGASSPQASQMSTGNITLISRHFK